MKARDEANKKGGTQARSDELGTVTLRVKPAPDAQERLRRVFALILAAAMRAESQGSSRRGRQPPDGRPVAVPFPQGKTAIHNVARELAPVPIDAPPRRR